jgi:hypothetical protein
VGIAQLGTTDVPACLASQRVGCVLWRTSIPTRRQPAGQFWWTAGLCRFEPGELDNHGIERLPTAEQNQPANDLER